MIESKSVILSSSSSSLSATKLAIRSWETLDWYNWFNVFAKYEKGDEKIFNSFKEETGVYDNFSDIAESIKTWSLEYQNKGEYSILAYYNSFLKEKGIMDVEFDYVRDKEGKRVFGVLQKKSADSSRRTVLMRSSCIGDLLAEVLKRYKKDFF